MPGVVVQAYNNNTQEARAEGGTKFKVCLAHISKNLFQTTTV